MAQFRNIFDIDLQRGRKEPFQLMQPVGEGDAKGIRVGARVTSNGADVDLGGQCVGKVIRADRSTVPLTGTISGNQAYVTLDQTCCAIEGPIQVAVAWVSGTNITTLVIAYGTVVNTITGNTVQPSTPIPDLTQLLAEIDAMRTATAAAEAAATKAVRYDQVQSLTNEQMATARNNINAARGGIIDIFAVAFSESTTYQPGAYATYNGSLYRFVADHPAGAWDSSHVVAVTVGNEINNTTVKTNMAQSLSGTGKAQARANIDAAAIGILAVAFDASTNYHPGDYCTYSGSLYRFIAEHTGAWNSAHVVAVTVGNEINTTTVKTNVSQSLTGDQKGRARNNIDAAAIGTLAVAFNTTTEYSAGQYCTYNGSLYRFITAHTGAWKDADVVAVTVGNEINATTVKTNLSQNLTDDQKKRARNNIDAAAVGNLAVAFSASTEYSAGQYCTYSGSLYRFIAAHTGAWDSSHVVAVTVGNEINTTTVKTNLAQNLTDDQKTRARNNIGAASADVVGELKSAIDEIDETYDTKKTIITSTEVTGLYVSTDGSITSLNALSYKQATIDSSLIGKEIKVTGTGWYSIKPYVFVPTSGTPIYPSVSPGTTVTQYTDLSFTPQTTGTLYVNRYSSNPPQIGEAYYRVISNVKAEYITSIDGVKDSVFYKVISLEMTSGKLLNGNTGAITDGSSDAYRVSQYVEVIEDTDYLITTEHFWSNGLYAWYDSNKNYISGVNSQSGGTRTKTYCQKVRSPKNAAYLVIGYLYQTNFPFPFLMEGENNSIMPSKRWSGKKWTCIGDSLTEAYTVTGAHYFDLISAATGIETVNKGVSGTGYARGTDNFMTRALTVPTDSDVVTFFGSGNDSGAGLELGTASDTGTDTLGGCINTAIDNLYSIMPVVQLGIVTPTPWQGNMPSDDRWMEGYSALIVNICKRRSIPCLDLFHCSNLNPNSEEVREIAYARDNGGGVHPSEAGHAIIAPRFLAFLESLLMH